MPEEMRTEIDYFSTESEFLEIANAIKNQKLIMPDLLSFTSNNSYNADRIYPMYKHMTLVTYEDPVNGFCNELSTLFPNAIFKVTASSYGEKIHTILCNGKIIDPARTLQDEIQSAYSNSISVFQKSTISHAYGTNHQVEIMPNGRIATFGNNLFGQCNTFEWKNIVQVACGYNHTIGLKDDGTVIACGSNACGQSDMSDIHGKVISVSCGRYYSALLLDDGSICLKGSLDDELQNNNMIDEPFKNDEFPLNVEMIIVKNSENYELMIQKLKSVSAGDSLIFKREKDKGGNIVLGVYNNKNEKVCITNTRNNDGFLEVCKKYTIRVDSLKKASISRNGKNAEMEVTLKLDGGPINQIHASKKIGSYNRMPFEMWPKVHRIKSIYDALIGITSNNEIFVDGYCPCSEAEIISLIS